MAGKHKLTKQNDILPDSYEAITDFMALARHNRRILKRYVKCYCYHCRHIYSVDKIKLWADDNNTAVCPRKTCGVDSVIPWKYEKPSEEFTLRIFNMHWGD